MFTPKQYQAGEGARKKESAQRLHANCKLPAAHHLHVHAGPQLHFVEGQATSLPDSRRICGRLWADRQLLVKTKNIPGERTPWAHHLHVHARPQLHFVEGQAVRGLRAGEARHHLDLEQGERRDMT